MVMEKKRIAPLLFSMLALCLCTIFVVGGTYALFTDTVTVNNHLEAGNLKVGLFRTSYQERVLDNSGLMSESAEDTTRVDLAADASKLFNVNNAVPTSRYQATVEVSNLGSTAFDYGMRILWKPNEDTTDNDEVFAAQIKITVTSKKLDAPVEFMLNACSEHDISLGYLLKNAPAETFTVKAEFVNDDANNNAAMLATLDFDVQVYATQKTSLD